MAQQTEQPPGRVAIEAKRRKKSTVPGRENDAPDLNSIERGRTRELGGSRPADNVKNQPPPPEARPEGEPPRPTSKDVRSRAMPEEIRERFIGIGANYYFPDGVTAFTDHGAKLSTRSENTEVIRSLVAIAQAREWREIKVAGTERFRKEAWFAARLAGIEVQGYRPTEFEQERLVRAVARRQAGAAGKPMDEARPDRSAEQASRDRSPSDPPARSSGDPAAIAGRLVDHGRATYKHDPKEPMSYYVRIETGTGDREIWGVDLERAFRESLSRPTIGDEVTARAYGSDSVTVSAPRRDDEGRIVGKQEIATHRHRWIVERSEFLAERAAAAAAFRDAQISASQGVKQYPELQGSYLQLQAAKLGAERDIRDAQDRDRFVARARAAIAEAIERGEPLEPVRLRERPAKAAEAEKARDHDRHQTPTR